MNKQEIMKILPHRDNMLLIDAAQLNEAGEAEGEYTVKGDEFFLQGHFPGNPVVPGVILCEIMAQTACVLFKDMQNITPMFTSLNNVRFKNPVRPGDVIKTKCAITNKKAVFYFAAGTCSVGDKLAASGEFSFALVPNDKLQNG